MEKELNKKDYSKTVNLPQTDFQMKANLAQREPAFVEEWQNGKIYNQMCEKNKSKKKFIFHDGPPYANGHIHIGTALNRVLKDMIIKFRSMSGYYVPYTPGWDCHGLPIEQRALKELKTDKNKVDRIVFRKQAADFAKKFIQIQKSEFQRLGTFADWDNPYLTLQPKFEASIIDIFASLVEKGFVYRKNKPVIWCHSCETALADAEVEYADHSADSIYVKFPIVELPKTLKNQESLLKDFSVLIWTTTPWTLPANVALMFNPKADYAAAIFKFQDKEEKLIIAKPLIDGVSQKISSESFKIVFEAKGADFVDIKCKEPFDSIKRLSRGIISDIVSMEDGSGIVHCAPGHGHEDYEAGLAYGLEIISPVNDKGLFTKDFAELENIHVFKATPIIVEKLKKEGKILAVQTLNHSYPHCWRCKKPIIFRATPQWFISIDHNDLRKRLLEEVDKVNWIPKYGQNRISGMLESRPDWCVSRQRLWGVPIPIFYCKKCGEPLVDVKVIKAVSKLFGEKGSDIWFSMSEKELLDGLNVKCSSCNSDDFRKEEDILDVWFDSGSSQEAVLASGNYKDLEFPADLYLEGSDQHRGWFHTSLILSVAQKDKAPYKSVLTHGFVVDGQGRKMSKSAGNGIESEDLIKRYGADILRIWVASSDYREDIRISDEILKGLSDSYRKMRNTIRFLLGNLNGFSADKKVPFKNLQEIDRYSLSRLDETIKQVNSAYENYEFHKVVNIINNFCAVFLSGFYLDILKDILYCDKIDSPRRLGAQSAMFDIASALIRMLAPILSFTAEEAWKEYSKFLGENKSVFLQDLPTPDSKNILSETEISKWNKVLALRQSAIESYEKLRQDKTIGSNLEAALTIKYGEAYKEVFADKEFIHLILGSWDIKAEFDASQKTYAIISSAKTQYPKCPRCWRHINNITVDGLCPRCAETVK
ncbi:MAG: isoleucine--tRNA ligase [Elusimicrobiota bacterium]|jgi:isoleucyl-tRNA synthetase|nr:isoleucine--tRNA ligase [Elusimicrobiota bacterium]